MARIVVRTHEAEITLKPGDLIAKAKAVSYAAASAWACCDWDNLRYKIDIQ